MAIPFVWQKLNLIITGINNALVPWMYKSLRSQRYDDIKTNSLKLIGMVVVGTGLLMLVSPELIMFLGTKEYLQAKDLVPLIMVSICITFIYCIYGTLLFFYEETKKVAFATTMGAIVNFMINLFL